MSLVGTRPPTVDEWDKYELHHRARLATKPGLTGMWQVSGRSNITDLLSFAPSNKRVSFAASISMSDIPEERQRDFVSALNGYKAISIREEAGATLISKMVGRVAETIIDPTLMLDREEWDKIAKRPKRIDCDKKYVLTYFLGGKSERAFNRIEKLRKDGYEIYNLLDRNQPELYVADPAEFVYLMSKASLFR